jgi:hypothetical protein
VIALLQYSSDILIWHPALGWGTKFEENNILLAGYIVLNRFYRNPVRELSILPCRRSQLLLSRRVLKRAVADEAVGSKYPQLHSATPCRGQLFLTPRFLLRMIQAPAFLLSCELEG